MYSGSSRNTPGTGTFRGFEQPGTSAVRRRPCIACGKSCLLHEICLQCDRPLHARCAIDGHCSLCQRAENISHQQAAARGCLQRQASKMLRRTTAKFAEVKVGDTVSVPIPSPDRARGDPPNVVGVVVEKTDRGLYKIGNRKGIIDQTFPRNAFALSKEKFISVEQVPNKTVSLRGMANAVSASGGQGFTRCNCRTGCTHGRCTCRAKGMKCNSKCHGSTSCSNK